MLFPQIENQPGYIKLAGLFTVSPTKKSIATDVCMRGMRTTHILVTCLFQIQILYEFLKQRDHSAHIIVIVKRWQRTRAASYDVFIQKSKSLLRAL